MERPLVALALIAILISCRWLINSAHALPDNNLRHFPSEEVPTFQRFAVENQPYPFERLLALSQHRIIRYGDENLPLRDAVEYVPDRLKFIEEEVPQSLE